MALETRAGTSVSTFPRWLPLLGGVLGSTTCGLLLYAFSVFIKPLQKQFGWSVAEVSLAYAIICLVFGLVCFPAGRLSDKYGPRNVVLVGGLLLAFGFYMTSTISTKWELYIYYGIIAGIGGGMIYLPPIATAPKWWPDRRAMATGFTVVGLGLGSFIMAPLATSMIAHFGGALPVFKYVGMAMAVMVVLAALCLKVPPAGWKPAGWNPPVAAAGTKASRDYTHEESKKTPQFWMLYIAYFCGSFAGLMVIGLIAAHGIDAMTNAYMAAHGGAAPSAAEAKAIAMSAAGATSALAAFNALTRLLIGLIADKTGTKILFIILFGIQVAAMAVLYPAGSSSQILMLVAALIGWNYGAMFTLFPATCLSYFGPTAQGSNYGLLFTAWGFAGFAGPYIGGLLRTSTGSYSVPFMVGAAVVVVSVIIAVIIKPPPKLSA